MIISRYKTDNLNANEWANWHDDRIDAYDAKRYKMPNNIEIGLCLILQI